jgi:hypothetical protein
MTENDIARVIFANLFPRGMCPADWDSGAILGPDNCVREQFLAAARALLSASIADTAGAKPIYQLQMLGDAWADVEKDEFESKGRKNPQWARIVYTEPPANPSDKQTASHHWGRDGDRCIKCGDKDWMANESCSQRLIKPSDKQEAKPPVAYHSFEECAKSVWDEMGNAPATPIDKQEPFAWMRPDVLDRLKSTIAYSAGTELLKNRKDGYVPIYATPPAPLAQSAEQDFESVWEKARVMDETTKTMARFIWNSARQSAEQDRIDAERWRYAVKHWLDEHIATKQADEAIAKGASK